jgi:uncharacterized membrane protein YdjX (TVP38/TMEM64 family)
MGKFLFMKKSKLKKYSGILVLFIFLVIVSWFAYSYFSKGFVYESFTGEVSSIVSRINSFKEISFLLFFLLIVFECVFAPFPPLILYIAGGAVFGWLESGIIGIFGNLIGAGLAFQISKHYGRNWVKKRVPEKVVNKLDKFSVKYGTLAIFLLRLNPITSSDLFSYAAGLTKINFKKFLVASTLALVPTIFAQTYLGEKIYEIPFLTEVSIFFGVLYIGGFLFFYFRKKF